MLLLKETDRRKQTEEEDELQQQAGCKQDAVISDVYIMSSIFNTAHMPLIHTPNQLGDFSFSQL